MQIGQSELQQQVRMHTQALTPVSTLSVNTTMDEPRRYCAAVPLRRQHPAHPAAGSLGRRQLLEASAAAMAVTAVAGGQTAGEALAAQNKPQENDDGGQPESPNNLTRMRAHW